MLMIVVDAISINFVNIDTCAQSVLDVQRSQNISIMVAKLGKASFFDLAKVM